MKIVAENPPNIDRLDALFKCRGQKVLFAWGDTIYNPMRIHIPNCLLAHEAVHGMRQMQDIEAWWEKYCTDQEYRYQEELAAHKVEYAVLASEIRDRNARAKLAMAIAAKLVSPLYAYVPPKALLKAQKELVS